MLRLLPRVFRTGNVVRLSSTDKASSSSTKPWEDPWTNALPKKAATYTDFEELTVDWKFVERLMPIEVIPEVPKHSSYPTPSGWRPPLSPSPQLPYNIRRRRDHMFALYLERKRDTLNEKTLDFDYVELVSIKNVDGDVFACEADLRKYLETKLGHPIATHVDELKGIIRIKGADRSLIESFLFDKGF